MDSTESAGKEMQDLIRECWLLDGLHRENLQMTNFMGSNNNSTETAGVFNDGNTVNFLQSSVDHTGASNISESCVICGKYLI